MLCRDNSKQSASADLLGFSSIACMHACMRVLRDAVYLLIVLLPTELTAVTKFRFRLWATEGLTSNCADARDLAGSRRRSLQP